MKLHWIINKITIVLPFSDNNEGCVCFVVLMAQLNINISSSVRSAILTKTRKKTEINLDVERNWHIFASKSCIFVTLVNQEDVQMTQFNFQEIVFNIHDFNTGFVHF
jgi:hypothetical protein